jgi:flavin-dependent dehydrogenase
LTAYLGRRGLDPARYRLRQFAEQGFEPGAAIAAPRVLLVGEAAGIDIATGEGIALAIEYGALAGPYLARALTTGDLAFAVWRQRVDRIRLGRQLRLRHLGYRAFYGRRRSALERVVPQIPTLLHVLTREFAGKRLSARAVVEGGAEWLGAMTRERAWLG